MNYRQWKKNYYEDNILKPIIDFNQSIREGDEDEKEH